MSAFLSITMITPETRMFLNPPLERIKEMQLLDFRINKNIKDEIRLNLFCDLVKTKSSYFNKIPCGEIEELNPSHLLAVIPSQSHPCIKVQQANNPINYFTLWLLDEDGSKPCKVVRKKNRRRTRTYLFNQNN